MFDNKNEKLTLLVIKAVHLLINNELIYLIIIK